MNPEPTHSSEGLTTAEVNERLAAGLGNVVDNSSSRSLADILRGNLFNLFNGIVGAGNLPHPPGCCVLWIRTARLGATCSGIGDWRRRRCRHFTHHVAH